MNYIRMRRKIIDCGGRRSEEFEAGTETRQEEQIICHVILIYSIS